MTAADDGRPGRAESGSDQAAGARSGERDLDPEGPLDRPPGGVKHNVDRVADKVKGLLRSRD